MVGEWPPICAARQSSCLLLADLQTDNHFTPKKSLEIQFTCWVAKMHAGEFDGLVSKTEEYVQSYMAQYKDPLHDWSHVWRVCKLAFSIAQGELDRQPSLPINLQLVQLAALLHDVGDAKFLAPGEQSESILRSFMSRVGFPQALEEGVLWITQRVSFRYELAHPQPESGEYCRELFCVQDADRLDAIGAVGVARCFSYNAVRNFPLYNEDQPPVLGLSSKEYNSTQYKGNSNARNHFYGKTRPPSHHHHCHP